MMRHHKSNDAVWSSYKTDVEGWTHKGGMPSQSAPIRVQAWNMSPLRSFKKFLFDAIDRQEFIDENGRYFRVTWDQAIMFPIVEMCGVGKCHFVPESFYYYRMHDNNDHAKGIAEQKRAEGIIRSRPSAKLLERYANNDVTVVVSCYNQLYVLPFFLEGMFFQRMCPREVVVADDGSSDEVCEWIDNNAHRYPFKISYVTREHSGYKLASLNNFASKHVKDGRILFTNADVIHSPDSTLSHSRVDGVGGGVIVGICTPRAVELTMDEIRDYETLSQIQKDNPSGRHNRGYIAKTNPQHNPIGVWGGNFSVPADKFHEVGGFDENFEGWGGEDNELVKRLISVGCRVDWVMDSEGIHLDHEHKKYAYDQEGSSYYLRKQNG
jgi:GT2 family glycosyltransferase